MKLTLPMLWSALTVFAALVLMPWLLMPSAPDQSQVLEAIRSRLERMANLMEEQNRLLAQGQASATPAELAPVRTSVVANMPPNQDLETLIGELRAAVGDLAKSGTPAASWQPGALRANLSSHTQSNVPVLQSLLPQLYRNREGAMDHLYFRSMHDVFSEFGRPSEVWDHNGLIYVVYKNIPCVLNGEAKDLDMDLRFLDGICVRADVH